MSVERKIKRQLLDGFSLEISEARVGDETGTIIMTVRQGLLLKKQKNIFK